MPKYVDTTLQSFHRAEDIETAYSEIFDQLRQHAIEKRDIEGGMIHLMLHIKVTEEKDKELTNKS